MSKRTSSGRAQRVLQSFQAPPTKNTDGHSRQPKAGPANKKASQAEPAPPALEGYEGSRKGSVVALHRKNIGIGAAEVKTKAHNEPAHRGLKPNKPDSSVEHVAFVGSAGIQRVGRSRNHPSKRASG